MSLETRRVLHSETGIPKGQHHSASLWPKRSAVREFVSGFEDSLDLAISNGSVGRCDTLGGLSTIAGLDPIHPESWQNLRKLRIT
jgi:hypothetical protein